MTSETLIAVPVGALGTGVRKRDMDAAIAAGAHAIALDAGTTDSGPAYLATGKAKYSRAALKRDLQLLMRAQAEARIPLLIGSCGTSGCDAALDFTYDIVREIAREEGFTPKIALLYSEQSAALLAQKADAGDIQPLAPMTDFDPAVAARCNHIVALLGPEPYIAALDAGADIVLGGRTTDTAVIAAAALRRGGGAGPAWHAAKIAECGGLCTRDPIDGGVMIRIGADYFEIEPLSAANACEPHGVAAHMLYENANPFRLTEPGGVLDVTKARYEAVSERVVRVTGSVFEPKPYTMKLEGAGGAGFQTVMLVGIQDPDVLEDVSRFTEALHRALMKRARAGLDDSVAFDISLRPYGWNAVSGEPVPSSETPPREIGMLFVATAPTQELATTIAKTCNPHFFHFPAKRGIELPSYAFPFSPAEMERGQVYEFLLNHVVRVRDGFELTRTEWRDLSVMAPA